MAVGPDRDSGLVSLLEALPDLAWAFPDDTPASTLRLLRVPAVRVEPGPWAPSEDDRVGAGPFGLIVTAGLVVREMAIGGHLCAQLLGPGDLLRQESAAGSALPIFSRITIVRESRFAVLGDRVRLLMQRWPAMADLLMQRALSQIDYVSALQAIAQLPRVSDRLLALLWHLADDWGRVVPQGVVVGLDLTHELLGQLIGARRSTVTLGLKELSEHGRLCRMSDGGWLLASDSIARLSEDERRLSPIGHDAT